MKMVYQRTVEGRGELGASVEPYARDYEALTYDLWSWSILRTITS